jgi:YgiT-type zinc finger domain-containing protein
MKCAICQNGSTTDEHITVTLDRDQTILVFKGVPAQVCDNCGEEYVSAEINRKLLEMAGEAARRGVTLELLQYAA